MIHNVGEGRGWVESGRDARATAAVLRGGGREGWESCVEGEESQRDAGGFGLLDLRRLMYVRRLREERERARENGELKGMGALDPEYDSSLYDALTLGVFCVLFGDWHARIPFVRVGLPCPPGT